MAQVLPNPRRLGSNSAKPKVPKMQGGKEMLADVIFATGWLAIGLAIIYRRRMR
jgi:hypothetical protein